MCRFESGGGHHPPSIAHRTGCGIIAPMANLRSLDLNLLTVFEAVYETGGITRAAERLALSPSATSHAIGRLREVCRDDLFVRVGQGIAPTPVAQRIYPEIHRSLEALRRALGEAQGFDPATAERGFEISIPHPLGPPWALAIRERARAEAPGVSLRFDTRTLPVEHIERMRGAELDLLVDWLTPADERFVLRKLFEDEMVLIARDGHPRIAPGATAAALKAEEFVRTHPRPGPLPEPILRLLRTAEEIPITWRLMVSEYLEIPYLVAHTDLLGFIPRTLALRAVHDSPLRIIPLPEAEVPIPVCLVWHETRRTDEGHRWLRDLVAEVVMAEASPPPG